MAKAQIKEDVVYTTYTQATSTPPVKVLTLEEQINNHTLYEIAKCESHLQQFNSNGTVLRGIVNNKDVGILQINERYHLTDSIRLGYDIYTLSGNIGYGKYLYEREGVTPWKSSRGCWQSKI